MMFLALSILDFGVTLSMLCAVAGLVFAFFLIKAIISRSAGNERMREIAGAVEEGAKAYLRRQVVTISAIAAVIFILLCIFKDSADRDRLSDRRVLLARGRLHRHAHRGSGERPHRAGGEQLAHVGAARGVQRRRGHGSSRRRSGAAFRRPLLHHREHDDRPRPRRSRAWSVVALGSSLISVFARLGGGIYTKAADVGADLVGKIESNLDEDDPRNPATIADNVGDNVGDCAGMAADVFETYAVSLIGAILIGCLTDDRPATDRARRPSFIRSCSAAFPCSARSSASCSSTSPA